MPTASIETLSSPAPVRQVVSPSGIEIWHVESPLVPLVALAFAFEGGAALQFEVDLTELNQLDQFRHRGVSSGRETGDWMHAFSGILLAPPGVEILRVDEAELDEAEQASAG